MSQTVISLNVSSAEAAQILRQFGRDVTVCQPPPDVLLPPADASPSPQSPAPAACPSPEADDAVTDAIYAANGMSLADRLAVVEAEIIRQALARNWGKRCDTARELGVSRVTLYNKMRSLGLFAGLLTEEDCR